MLPLLMLSLVPASTGSSDTGYRLPPREVVEVVDAAPEPSVLLSPDGSAWLELHREAMPPVSALARRMLRLAGLRIDPAASSRFSTTSYTKLALHTRSEDGGVFVAELEAPDGSRITGASWSPDSKRFAYTVVDARGKALWLMEGREPKQATLVTGALHSVFGGYGWLPGSTGLLLHVVPSGLGDEPEAPAVPDGPNIQETHGTTSPLRTYQDLLSSEHDAALFEHYATSQLALFDFGTSELRTIGAPGLLRAAEPSPDGEHLLVRRIARPFSYLHPYYQFPQTIEVWDLEGNAHVVAKLPLVENVPIGGVATGPRNPRWLPGSPATVLWVEALDGGDPKREVEARDRWMQLAAPFDGAASELLRTEHRARGLTFADGGASVLAAEYDRDRRWTRTLVHRFGSDTEPVVLEDRSIRDRYGSPGYVVETDDGAGQDVALQSGDWIYRAGSGASPEGLLPFLDRQNLRTGESERLWRCELGAYEQVVEVFAQGDDGDQLAFVTSHETPTTPPNLIWREGDTKRALTAFADPTPSIRGIKKELLTYERPDGVPLSATLYLPADHQPGTRLPLFVWAYPREFNDAKTAGQVTSSPSRFTRIRGTSHLALLTQGYAILDGATMPIIGDPETMNDTFVEQIVGAAQAAIDKAVELGVADKDRVAVGGHSYGAFMTANLLAHCDLFRAGIARSGAYNRTLTPFGFQSERRTFWEAPDAYFKVSPFMHAHEIDEPVLLIHGEVDNNSGTYPLQSKRMYQAIKGNGGTARLVMLPHESHGYRGRESVLHVQAEMIEWLDRHVKGGDTPAAASYREP